MTKRRQIPESFLAPDGQVYSTYRAVSFDNWLLWRDALPDNPALWCRLELPQYQAITELGRRINVMHQAMPDYKRLSDTPFTVSRWWDPLDDEENWHTGSRCLLRIGDYTINQLPLELADRQGLDVMPVSTHWAEFSLTADRGASSPRRSSS
jgi:hypothetical protein